jgi:outer membrane lipoprotein SlyB
MKRKWIAIVLLLPCAGCSSMNNTESGAIGGGLIGGALGTMFGLAARNPVAGAAIGAAAGAGIGALAGNSEDKREQRQKDQVAAINAANQQAAANAPRLEEIVSMSRNGVSDVNIINQIRQYNVVYHLSPDDLSYLSANGVSPQVISSMQTAPPPIYVGGYYRPCLDYYPPPVSVGVGFVGGGYYRRY